MQAESLGLADNLLTGPAFPLDWTMPGALPSLTNLGLTGNPGLTGTLPPDLSWPKLNWL